MCLRSGINRLRVRATEQTSLAHTVTGATASFSAAIALATAAQARAGASYLAGKLARLLHRNIGDLVPAEGIPLWELLLDSSYMPSKNATTKETCDGNYIGFKAELDVKPVSPVRFYAFLAKLPKLIVVYFFSKFLFYICTYKLVFFIEIPFLNIPQF